MSSIEQKKNNDRIDSIKSIAKQLNAEYKQDKNNIMKRFDLLYDEEIEGKKANFIVGNKNGYEYCFFECFNKSYDRKRHKDTSCWISKLVLRMKDDSFPDFHLMTKESAIFDIKFLGIIGLILVGIIILLNYFSKNNASDIFSFIFGFIVIYILFRIICILKDIIQQDKYRIRNNRFKEKYIILDGSDVNKINNVFNDEVCSKILNYKSNLDITIKKHCLSLDFSPDEQLSFLACNKNLNILLDQAKLFEKESSF